MTEEERLRQESVESLFAGALLHESVAYPEHHPSAFPIAPYTTDLMFVSWVTPPIVLTRLSRLTLQTPPRDPQCVVQDVNAGVSDHAVPCVQGALPDKLKKLALHEHAAEPAAD